MAPKSLPPRASVLRLARALTAGAGELVVNGHTVRGDWTIEDVIVGIGMVEAWHCSRARKVDVHLKHAVVGHGHQPVILPKPRATPLQLELQQLSQVDEVGQLLTRCVITGEDVDFISMLKGIAHFQHNRLSLHERKHGGHFHVVRTELTENQGSRHQVIY
jgi:hypothetical protein